MSDNKNANHYIDSEEFTKEMQAHAVECRAAREKGEEMPRCPESIAKKFILISEGVAKKGNFYKYPFKDEMISDAIESMLRYRYNFDEQLGQAFSYFTTYARYAFMTRIKKEKKELTKKARYVQKAMVHEIESQVTQDQDTSVEFKNEFLEYLAGYYDEKLDEQEKNKVKKKKPAKKKKTKKPSSDASPLC